MNPGWAGAASRLWRGYAAHRVGVSPAHPGRVPEKERPMPRTKKSRNHRLSEEERAARRAADRKLMSDSVEALRSSEGWHRWLSLRSRFHNYSLANQLLIAFQKPEATRVAGFRRWLDLGYAVQKGERGISIWAPCPPSKTQLEEWRRQGSDPQLRPKTYFRMVKVFDRSQVAPLPEFPGGPIKLDPPVEPIEGDGLRAYLNPIKGYAASIGYSFEIGVVPKGINGFCDVANRRIVVRSSDAVYSPNAQVKTAVYEISHALIHHSTDEDDPALSRGEEEVVVESVAFSVCSSLGLDTSGFSVPYVAIWGDGSEIQRYAALIDRLASSLEDALLVTGGTAHHPVASAT
jgi:antirestriction protein ArdC